VTEYDRQHIQHKIDTGGALVQAVAQIGWGLNLAMIASISLIVAGFVWNTRREVVAAATPVSDEVDVFESRPRAASRGETDATV